jgi:hypothetical protein
MGPSGLKGAWEASALVPVALNIGIFGNGAARHVAGPPAVANGKATMASSTLPTRHGKWSYLSFTS